MCLSAAPAEEVQNEDEEVDDVHVKLDAGKHVVVAPLARSACHYFCHYFYFCTGEALKLTFFLFLGEPFSS